MNLINTSALREIAMVEYADIVVGVLLQIAILSQESQT